MAEHRKVALTASREERGASQEPAYTTVDSSFPWWYALRWMPRFIVPCNNLPPGPFIWDFDLNPASNELIPACSSPPAMLPPPSSSAVEDSDITTIVAFGDLMPMASPWGGPPKHVDQPIKDLFASADVILGNLETPVLASVGSAHTWMAPLFHSLPAAALDAWLAACAIDPHKLSVSLANNHIYDQGSSGLDETVRLLEQRGIQALGTERTPRAHHVHRRVRVAAWTQWLNLDSEGGKRVARQQDVLAHDWQEQEQEQDTCLIGLPHWDIEFNYFPAEDTQLAAHHLLSRGFDVLLGGHTHTPQPLMLVNGKPCAYSMGDFNGFPAPASLQPAAVRVGQLVQLTLVGAQVAHVRTYWVEWRAEEEALVMRGVPDVFN